MKFLVTGSTGVLGRHTLAHLLARRHEVWALVRAEEQVPGVEALGAHAVQGDVRAPVQLTAVLAQVQPDAVVHLATNDGPKLPVPGGAWRELWPVKIPTTNARHWSAWDANDRMRREGTRNLLAAARSAAVPGFVLASVGRVYEGGQQWVAEGALTFPHRLVRSALDAERQALIAAEQGELHTLILRVGDLYSADDYQTRQLVSHLRRGRLPIPGRGANFRSLVHAADAGQAFALAVEAAGSKGLAPGTIINVSDDEPVQTGRLLRHLARLLGARRPILLPNLLLKLVAGQYPAWAWAQSVRLHNTRARELLGFQPRYPTYREGYAAVIPRT